MFYVPIKYYFKFKEKRLIMKFYSKEQLEKIGLKSLANNVNQYNYSILSGGVQLLNIKNFSNYFQGGKVNVKRK